MSTLNNSGFRNDEFVPDFQIPDFGGWRDIINDKSEVVRDEQGKSKQHEVIKHIYKTKDGFRIYNEESIEQNDLPSSSTLNEWRRAIEPWLTTLFHSEHLSLLVGSGLTTAINILAKAPSQGMGRLQSASKYNTIARACADKSAQAMERGEANLEDDLREALALIRYLESWATHDPNAFLTSQIPTILEDIDAYKIDVYKAMHGVVGGVLAGERALFDELQAESPQAEAALSILQKFLLSFSCRASSRERLHVFTTNYDRNIEFACDEAGILTLDRFRGKVTPIFRNTRLELDFHYNPPGIRGEPRYVEGVVRLTKLHGSLDWRFRGKGRIEREHLPFGAKANHPAIPSPTPVDGEPDPTAMVIYPNADKDVETAYYPYAELFRDFSAAACRPNSTLVIYGYSFGDHHINRIIEDMLTLPSTHMVVIARDDNTGRLRKFLNNKSNSQITLLFGRHFANPVNLVNFYLPRPGIERLQAEMSTLLKTQMSVPLPTKDSSGSEPQASLINPATLAAEAQTRLDQSDVADPKL